MTAARRRTRTVKIYRGVAQKEAAPREAVPVAEGLVSCPACGAGVKTVGSPFADPEVGLKLGERVVGSHAPGGHTRKRNENACLGTYTRPTEDP